jgi:hypothetical protein
VSAAETANAIAGWALSVSIGAAVVALIAAGFAGWQAITAHRSRLAENEGTVVEWQPAEWISADTVLIASDGPDDARKVWGRLNIDHRKYIARASRVRPGGSLKFSITGWQSSWDWGVRNRPEDGEQWTRTTAFSYGGLIVWRNRYGRRFSVPLQSSITRVVRTDSEPYPRDAPEGL